MIWVNGLTYNEKMLARKRKNRSIINRGKEWKSWFAWFPVIISEENGHYIKAWLEIVERSLYFPYESSGETFGEEYIYRIPDKSESNNTIC